MAIPTQVQDESGASAASQTTLLPAGWEAGDIVFVFVSCLTTQSLPTTTGATPKNIAASDSGWTQMEGSPQTVTGGSRLYGFWRRMVGGDVSPQTGDSGEYNAFNSVAIRGALASGTPFEALAFGSEATSDTSLSIPSITTLGSDRLILGACTTGADKTSAQFDEWANAKLSEVEEIKDVCTNAGDGGGVASYSGGKAVAGETGATTATLAGASPKAFVHLAVIPVSTEPKEHKVELEDNAGFSESRGAADALARADSQAVTDSLTRSSSLTHLEAQSFAEALERVSAAKRLLEDPQPFTESKAADLATTLAESFGAGDSLEAVLVRLLELAEQIDFAEDLHGDVGLTRADIQVLGETRILALGTMLADVLGLSEAHALASGRSLAEAQALLDAHSLVADLGRSEDQAFAEALTFAAAKGLAETLLAAESSALGAIKALGDVQPLEDSTARRTALGLAEGVMLSDLLALGGAEVVALEDALALAESLMRAFALGRSESFVAEDALTRAWSSEAEFTDGQVVTDEVLLALGHIPQLPRPTDPRISRGAAGQSRGGQVGSASGLGGAGIGRSQDTGTTRAEQRGALRAPVRSTP